MIAELARVAVVAVGDELLAGAHPDLDSPILARFFGARGLPVTEVRVVGDDEEVIARAVVDLTAPGTLVVLTGGLGPTLDDVTRHAVARALGCEVVEDADARRAIEAWFDARGMDTSPANLRQALFPRGATVVPNPMGTAPGFWIEEGDLRLLSLPGPPREVEGILHASVEPLLAATGHLPPAPPTHRFHLFGTTESAFAADVGDWMARDADPRIGCSAKGGVLTVVLRARDAGAASRRRLDDRTTSFRARFTDLIFSEDTGALEEALGRLLLAHDVTIAVAESCTAGLVTSRLARVPGISAVLGEGIVTYANSAKVRLLGIAESLLEEHGAVSAEVAEAMALGVAAGAGARLGVSITGIAGPGGGTEEKPVGLVWFGVALDGEVTSSSRRFPPRDRQWIRSLAASTALDLARRRLEQAGLPRTDS